MLLGKPDVRRNTVLLNCSLSIKDMVRGSVINVVFLCVVNGVFTVAGTILNSLVILCLWKSSQLRKKLCYFLLLILSCCDLIVVIVNHPLIIRLAIAWAMEDHGILERMHIFRWVNNGLFGFSSIALLTMTIERYLATAHPLFHRRSVTKRRLVAVLATLQLAEVVSTTVQAFLPTAAYLIGIIIVLVIYLASVLFMNCKMFVIAMAARRNGTDKRSAVNFKNASTCLLAALCFFCCCIPSIFYYCFELFSTFNDDILMSCYLWATTAISLDSCTFNCFLFFWRNKILRIEGEKVLKRCRFRTSKVNPF